MALNYFIYIFILLTELSEKQIRLALISKRICVSIITHEFLNLCRLAESELGPRI